MINVIPIVIKESKEWDKKFHKISKDRYTVECFWCLCQWFYVRLRVFVCLQDKLFSHWEFLDWCIRCGLFVRRGCCFIYLISICLICSCIDRCVICICCIKVSRVCDCRILNFICIIFYLSRWVNLISWVSLISWIIRTLTFKI